MKRLAMVLLLVVAALGVAAEPAVVTLRPDFRNLMPEARYHITVRAAYVIFNPSLEQEIVATSKDPAFRAFPAQDVATFDFIGGRSTAMHAAVFHLPADVPPPPPGLASMISFSTHVEITPAAGSAVPPIANDNSFGMKTVAGPAERCLRVMGPLPDHMYFVGVADCSRPVPGYTPKPR
jgi:hypothetical protein